MLRCLFHTRRKGEVGVESWYCWLTRSQSVFHFSLLLWQSRRQTLTALSAPEAEVAATSDLDHLSWNLKYKMKVGGLSLWSTKLSLWSTSLFPAYRIWVYDLPIVSILQKQTFQKKVYHKLTPTPPHPPPKKKWICKMLAFFFVVKYYLPTLSFSGFHVLF